MSDLFDSNEFRDLERSALSLAARIRRLREALGTVAALTSEIAALQEAVAGLSLGAPAQPAPPPATAVTSGDEREPGQHLAPERPPLPLAAPGANGGAGSAGGGAIYAVERQGEPPAGPVRLGPPPPNVAVTVSTHAGSIDLVRLYRALQKMPQVLELNLTSYNGGRAVVGLTTPARPQDLPIGAALQEAFPEGVVGDWVGDSEFVAVIAAAG